MLPLPLCVILTDIDSGGVVRQPPLPFPVSPQNPFLSMLCKRPNPPSPLPHPYMYPHPPLLPLPPWH